MSNNSECGCTDNNCPHRTSEVTLFDGQFTSINVPSGASLNDVLALLESFVLTSSQCNDVNYTLSSFSSCLNLPAGTYSFQQIIDAIISRACENFGLIQSLQEQISETTTILSTEVILDELVFPTCYLSFTGTTATDLFNQLMSDVCSLLTQIGPVIDDDITVTPPDPGTQADPGGTTANARTQNSRIEHIAEAIKSIVDNNSYVYEHTSPVTSPASFVVGLSPMRGVVDNYLVVRKFSEDLTVNPTVDTYFFLSGDSTILRREVANGAPAPATPSVSHELYRVVSDGSGVTAVDVLFTSSALNPTALGPESVDTINIVDDAVTSDKMDDIITGTTSGDVTLFRFRTNAQGRVTSQDGNLLISAPSNGQVLGFNSALNRFENQDNINVASANTFPKANAAGTDYENSSITETTNQVRSIKKVEVNTGVPEDDADAIMNLVGDKYFLVPRMEAAQAGALAVTDGAFIYVTSVDATFTSVGFWGVENSTWVKL